MTSATSQKANSADRVVHWATRLLGLGAAVLLFAMMVLTFVDVWGRYFFNSPVPGGFEVTELMMAALIFAGLPLATGARRAHRCRPAGRLPCRPTCCAPTKFFAMPWSAACMLAECWPFSATVCALSAPEQVSGGRADGHELPGRIPSAPVGYLFDELRGDGLQRARSCWPGLFCDGKLVRLLQLADTSQNSKDIPLPWSNR